MFDLQAFHRQRQGNFGKTLYYFLSIDSTNRFTVELAQQSAPEGIVVLAEEQTAGAGRKGNAWYSPAGVNLYFSIILRPQVSRLHYLPYMAAIALYDSIAALGVRPDLKWPNDILLNQKKVAGTMILTSIEHNRLQYAVLGCGINVNGTTFTPELRYSATSLALEKGSEVSRDQLLRSFLFAFENLYEKIDVTPWEDLCRKVDKRSSYVRGCNVRIYLLDGEIEGVTEGLDLYGGLILNTSSGPRVIYAGDVQACRKS